MKKGEKKTNETLAGGGVLATPYLIFFQDLKNMVFRSIGSASAEAWAGGRRGGDRRRGEKQRHQGCRKT